MTTFTKPTEALILTRANHACERCGQPNRGVRGRDWSIHHRRPRGMGGTKRLSTASVGVVLCGSGVTGCHGWVESNRADAIDLGWLVSALGREHPRDIPIIHITHGFVFIDDNGGVTPAQQKKGG